MTREEMAKMKPGDVLRYSSGHEPPRILVATRTTCPDDATLLRLTDVVDPSWDTLWNPAGRAWGKLDYVHRVPQDPRKKALAAIEDALVELKEALNV